MSELERIAASDDLHVAPFREDGKTYGTLTWIWSVVLDGELYARAYNGPNSRWYQAAMRQGAGRVTVAGMTRDVAFEAVEGEISDQIDEAYRSRYSKSSYLVPMISEGARAATVRIAPKG
ncbi:DUF2255 family protein [Paraburkholderia sp. HP33-1]|uniref:DUF2255 family protein n=1 Tax=Paraburkholderia sp. HP33-1 TaxID=2883243 RepID=UPI001F224381|nr:DUF2255 family protein [Paraburkholderia sp. HP33-1]